MARARRRLPLPKPPSTHERAYTRALLGYTKRFQQLVREELERVLPKAKAIVKLETPEEIR